MSDYCVNTHDNYGISGLNDRTISSVSTLTMCWYLCLKETSFVCNSAEYIYTGDDGHQEGLCKLSTTTSYSSPPHFTAYPDTHLKERCP